MLHPISSICICFAHDVSFVGLVGPARRIGALVMLPLVNATARAALSRCRIVPNHSQRITVAKRVPRPAFWLIILSTFSLRWIKLDKGLFHHRSCLFRMSSTCVY